MALADFARSFKIECRAAQMSKSALGRPDRAVKTRVAGRRSRAFRVFDSVGTAGILVPPGGVRIPSACAA
jgi:hypothetical protein